jgi:hypothetical protein
MEEIRRQSPGKLRGRGKRNNKKWKLAGNSFKNLLRDELTFCVIIRQRRKIWPLFG